MDDVTNRLEAWRIEISLRSSPYDKKLADELERKVRIILQNALPRATVLDTNSYRSNCPCIDIYCTENNFGYQVTTDQDRSYSAWCEATEVIRGTTPTTTTEADSLKYLQQSTKLIFLFLGKKNAIKQPQNVQENLYVYYDLSTLPEHLAYIAGEERLSRVWACLKTELPLAGDKTRRDAEEALIEILNKDAAPPHLWMYTYRQVNILRLPSIRTIETISDAINDLALFPSERSFLTFPMIEFVIRLIRQKNSLSEELKSKLRSWQEEYIEFIPPGDSIIKRVENDQKPYFVVRLESKSGACTPQVLIKNNLGVQYVAAAEPNDSATQRHASTTRRNFRMNLLLQLEDAEKQATARDIELEHYDACIDTFNRCLSLVRERRAVQPRRYLPGCIRLRHRQWHSRPPNTSEFWLRCETRPPSDYTEVVLFQPTLESHACHILHIPKRAAAGVIKKEATRMLQAPSPPMVLLAEDDLGELSVDVVAAEFRECRTLGSFLNAINRVMEKHNRSCFLITDDPRTFEFIENEH